MQLLLVEDDPVIALSSELILLDAGHTICGCASSATRAITIMEDGPSTDLALVDINLIDGQSAGIAFARQLKSRWGVPSLFVSGRVQAACANCDAALGIVSKPY